MRIRHLAGRTLAAGAALAGWLAHVPLAEAATQYPLTVTDMAGRSVTISAEPQRIALQDGRDGMMLALLDRDDPFKRVVIWNNLIGRGDAGAWSVLTSKWPDATKIPDMGFSDNGEVDAERILSARPQLVIVERRALPTLEAAGVPAKLDALHIPMLAIDTFVKPVPDAVGSVDLLGKVLNRETEASQYHAFYTDHLKAITDATAKVSPAPRVFVEALAGRSGPEQCCFTHNTVGWGLLVQAIGAHNIGSDLLHSATGDVTLETVLAQKPDVYIMSGVDSARKGNVMVPLGYKADAASVTTAAARLESRPGFAQLSAAKSGRVFSIWHSYYADAYNIVGLEYLAKFAYPDQFKTLDPAETYRTLIAKFTHIPAAPFIFAAKAPPAG